MDKLSEARMSDMEAVKAHYPKMVITDYSELAGEFFVWSEFRVTAKVIGKGKTRKAALADARARIEAKEEQL